MNKEVAMSDRELLRVEEAARVLALSRSKLFLMIAAGELPVVRFGRALRIPRRQLERWIADRTEWAA
jgi:excisionase family DNA binding protein